MVIDPAAPASIRDCLGVITILYKSGYVTVLTFKYAGFVLYEGLNPTVIVVGPPV